MNNIFSRSRQKQRRRASTNDVPTERTQNVYLGPKRRSSQDTLVFNRFDLTQEHYGQLASSLSTVNRTLNSVLRDVINGDNSSPSIGTDPHHHSYDYDSDDTAASIDSLQISGFKIFGKAINEYNAKRYLPIVSMALKTGQLVFSSQQSVDHFKKSRKLKKRSISKSRRASSSSSQTVRHRNGSDEIQRATSNETSSESAVIDDDEEDEAQYEEDSNVPLFHVSTPPLAQFRKNCPFLIVSKFYTSAELRSIAASGNDTNEMEDVTKYTFCKVYDKYLKCGVKRFILEFYPDPQNQSVMFKVVMFTHRSKPYTDTIYKGTKLRFVGSSVATSVFGSSTIQLMIMNEENAISLVDDMTEDDKPNPSNPLLREQTTLTDISGGAICFKLYGNSTLPPFAKFTDSTTETYPRKMGQIFCYEAIDLRNRDELYGDYNNIKQVKLDTMVLTCMILILREQENKKNPRAFNSQFARGLPYYGFNTGPGIYGPYDSAFPVSNMW